MQPMFGQKIYQRLCKPLALMMPCYEFEGEVASDEGPMGIDVSHASTNKPVLISLRSPSIVDKTKAAGEGVRLG